MRTSILLALLFLCSTQAAENWRQIPLVTNGKIDPNWAYTGYGKFIVDDGAIRTDPSPEGLGLLFYKKEKLGNCQIKVVFKTKETRSNSGIYIRIDDGILDQVSKPGAPLVRDAAGKPTPESSEKQQASGEREEGPWYAVHRGYEVQIAGNSTATIYSLANAPKPAKEVAGQWREMLITLDGDKISTQLDGEPMASFDTSAPNPPERKIWHAPKREPKRPQAGYIGLQTHDPADNIVWFKEISVRPLPKQLPSNK